MGTNLDSFDGTLTRLLRRFDYLVHSIRLSQLLTGVYPHLDRKMEEGSRLDAFMRAGTQLRLDLGRGDALVLHAIASIARRRERLAKPSALAPMPRTAHVLRSLKHPDEVTALRQVYGPGFFLLGLYAPEEARRRHLIMDRGIARDNAEEFLKRDQDEGDELGQQTRRTFALSDAFVRTDERLEASLSRILDLIFGCPSLTPQADEHGMFLAFASALRSGDLSRQVGAAIRSATGEIIAIGANDAPMFGGGQYWPGSTDRRDVAKGEDTNESWRQNVVKDLAGRFGKGANLDGEEWVSKVAKLLEGSPVMDVTEYGRAVHAEMEALLSCARSSVSPKGATLYSTTFPCHNCAKHIVAAGVDRVVFVEPYPKSRAPQLHGDAIVLEQRPRGTPRVLFEPFIGVGPRRFFDLFSLELGSGRPLKRKKSGRAVVWTRKGADPRIGLSPSAYMLREKLAISELTRRIPR